MLKLCDDCILSDLKTQRNGERLLFNLMTDVGNWSLMDGNWWAFGGALQLIWYLMKRVDFLSFFFPILHPFAVRSSTTCVPCFRQDWKLIPSIQLRITDVCILDHIWTEWHQIHMTQRQQKDISRLIWSPRSGCRLTPRSHCLSLPLGQVKSILFV